MDNQEAIDELQYAIDLIKQDGKDWIDERDIPILETAIHALEKQIPKKSCSTSSFFRYNCPSCGNHFPLNGKYCDNCGQALDWEESER